MKFQISSYHFSKLHLAVQFQGLLAHLHFVLFQLRERFILRRPANPPRSWLKSLLEVSIITFLKILRFLRIFLLARASKVIVAADELSLIVFGVVSAVRTFAEDLLPGFCSAFIFVVQWEF